MYSLWPFEDISLPPSPLFVRIRPTVLLMAFALLDVINCGRPLLAVTFLKHLEKLPSPSLQGDLNSRSGLRKKTMPPSTFVCLLFSQFPDPEWRSLLNCNPINCAVVSSSSHIHKTHFLAFYFTARLHLLIENRILNTLVVELLDFTWHIFHYSFKRAVVISV